MTSDEMRPCPFEVWECTSCGGIYRPPAVTQCDCTFEPHGWNRYLVSPQAVVDVESIKKPYAGLSHDEMDWADGWNSCVKFLVSSGIIKGE